MGRIEVLNELAELKEIQKIAAERRAAIECELGIQRCEQHGVDSKNIPRVHPSDQLPAKTADELRNDHETRDALRPVIDALAAAYVGQFSIWAMRALQGLIGFGGGDPIRSDKWYDDTVASALNKAGAGLTHYLELGLPVPARHFPTDVDSAKAVLRGGDAAEDTL